MKIVSREFICKKIAGCISKNSPEWRFWDAILWIKNAARNKQISSAPWFVTNSSRYQIKKTIFQSESEKTKTEIVLRMRLKMSSEESFKISSSAKLKWRKIYSKCLEISQFWTIMVESFKISDSDSVGVKLYNVGKFTKRFWVFIMWLREFSPTR